MASAFWTLPSIGQANAGGGSGSQTTGGAAGNQEMPSAYATVTSGSMGTTAAVQDVLQYDYILVPVAFEGNSAHVSAVMDNDSNTYTQVSVSSTNNDVELWCAQMTHATGGLKVTVTSSASATYSFNLSPEVGLTSCSAATAEIASGSTSTTAVASFTPATGNFCYVTVADNTGGSSTFSITNPFQYIYNNAGAPPSANIGAHYYIVNSWRGSWNSNDGATTAPVTATSTSSPKWDELVDCFTTLSAGNEMYAQSGWRGGARSANNPSAGVNSILKGDFILGVYVSEGTASSLTSLTDQASDTYFDTQYTTTNVIQLWLGQVSASAANPDISGTGTCTACALLGWDFAGLASASATPQTATAHGTTADASVASFTPNAGDLCVAFVVENTGTGGATWTLPGDSPWRVGATGTISGDYYWVGMIRPDWPSGVSTIAEAIPSSTSSPSWSELVACYAGTVAIPLTCTMASSAPAATVTLTESSGNSITPTTATCNGTTQTIWADPSVTVTATEPSDLTNTRYRFSGPSTTTTFGSCSASTVTCSSWSFTNYYQLQNTYTASPKLGTGSTTWDTTGTSDIALSYTGAGSPSTCYLSTTSGGGAVSCASLWVDYHSSVTFGTLTVSPTERWLPSADSTTYTITTGGGTVTGDYSRQWQVQFAVSPSSTYGSISPTSTSFYNDTSSVPVTGTPNAGYAFSDWTASSGSITFGSTSASSTGATIGAAGTITANFVTLSLAAAVSDAYSFSDSVARGLALTQSTGDSSSPTDSPSTMVVLGRGLSDSFVTSEVVSANSVISRIVSDTFAFAESTAENISLHVAVSDTLSYLEGVVTQATLTRTASDSISLVDSVLRQVGLERVSGDSISLSESITENVALQVAVSDSFSYLEGAVSQLGFVRTASDSISLSELTTQQSLITRTISDAYGYTEAGLASVIIGRAVGDMVSYSESAGRSLGVGAAITDVISYAESGVASVGLSRIVGDLSSFGEAVSSASGLERSVSDAIPFSDAVSRALTIVVGVADSIQYVDGFQPLVKSLESIVVNVADTYLFSESNSVLAAFSRSVSDLYGVGESIQRQLSLAESVGDVIIIGSSVSRAVVLSEIVGDVITLIDAAGGSATTVSTSSSTSQTQSTVSSTTSTSQTTSTSTTTTHAARPSVFPAAVAVALVAALAAIAAAYFIFGARRRREKDE